MDRLFLLLFLTENDNKVIKDWLKLNPSLKKPENVLRYILRNHPPKQVSNLSRDLFDEDELDPEVAPENVENIFDKVERIDPSPAPEAKFGIKNVAKKLDLASILSIRSGRK